MTTYLRALMSAPISSIFLAESPKTELLPKGCLVTVLGPRIESPAVVATRVVRNPQARAL